MNKFIIILVVTLLYSCAGTKVSSSAGKAKLLSENVFLVMEFSEDPTYGYKKSNPVKVGGIKESNGPLNERRFLNALTGPNGESISYQRLHSCCHFKTKNGIMGAGLLDVYSVSWEGLDEPVLLYINMYDHGPLKVPKGFTIRQF